MKEKNMPKKSFKPIAVFKEPPEFRHHLLILGKSYWLGKITPWPCSDGRQSYVLTWATRCAKCDMPFTATSGMTIYWLNRHCPLHRRKKSINLEEKIAQAKFVLEQLFL